MDPMKLQKRLSCQEFQPVSMSKLRVALRELIMEMSGKTFALVIRESPRSQESEVFTATVFGSLHPSIISAIQAQADRRFGFDVAIRFTGN